MNQTIRQLLEGKADNHMLPFFWQHGEEEATLRKYMEVIQGANCHAVCVESRPHPDFCGPKWWQDMDVILDEARKRNMKVWILDDSHFPTGFANGALKDKPDTLCKQSVFLNRRELPREAGAVCLDLRAEGLLELDQKPFDPPARIFDDDTLLYVGARNSSGQLVELTSRVSDEVLQWDKPEGNWTLLVLMRSRNAGSRRNYINIMEPESCEVLIQAVYEPHWQHYAEDFGKTIAGFFSDEPELGNAATYRRENPLGTDQDLPWGPSLEAAVAAELGENWAGQMHLLWLDGEDAPRVRSIYMDCVTRLVRESFSCRLGDWCRKHGVRYIGHLIEDDGQHCRTSCSLGHYFRGLQGQDMSGIDNIGGQVLPQGEDDPTPYFLGSGPRKGEFYHYGLAKLAQSAAAIEPRKQGNSMCEIFGNYGWVEGVRMEKYMADHFLVRGINQFVPHAFSAKAFPDPDCPPHFYAHGHNPQIRHFGEICGYMNRVATLTSSGKHAVPVAVLYHGESEWADSDAMAFEVPLRALYDRQIDCHVIPVDVFTEQDYYRTELGNPLVVNGQVYEALVVPETEILPDAAAAGLLQLTERGMPVFFVNSMPKRLARSGGSLPEGLRKLPVVPLSRLGETVGALGIAAAKLEPACDRIRILQIRGDTPVFFLVNEGAECYRGSITLPVAGECWMYDPWDNLCRPAEFAPVESGTRVELTMEPLKSTAVVFGSCDAGLIPPVVCEGAPEELTSWRRSICEGAEHPRYGREKAVILPDNIALELPDFSGFARYETSLSRREGKAVLEITAADEGVEVFLNGSSLGIQIAPPFRYDLTGKLVQEENSLIIEVATTLERQCFRLLDDYGKAVTKPPAGKTGLTGRVCLYSQ